METVLISEVINEHKMLLDLSNNAKMLEKNKQFITEYAQTEFEYFKLKKAKVDIQNDFRTKLNFEKYGDYNSYTGLSCLTEFIENKITKLNNKLLSLYTSHFEVNYPIVYTKQFVIDLMLKNAAKHDIEVEGINLNYYIALRSGLRPFTDDKFSIISEDNFVICTKV